MEQKFIDQAKSFVNIVYQQLDIINTVISNDEIWNFAKQISIAQLSLLKTKIPKFNNHDLVNSGTSDNLNPDWKYLDTLQQCIESELSNTVTFYCNCLDKNHQLTIDKDIDFFNETTIVTFSFQIRRNYYQNFFKRIWLALGFIFKRNNLEYDSVELNSKDAYELRKFLQFE